MPTHMITTRTTTSGVAVHTIGFRGLAGAIFTTLVIALVLYVIGFATTAWSLTKTTGTGLWGTCLIGSPPSDDWFRAVQAMITIGLIGLAVAFLLACLYLCIHSVSKNTTILALVIVCFVSVLFMLIGIIIFGVRVEKNLSWSFALTVIATVLCFVAGIMSVVQMRESGVRM